jgi:hypothetical protein
MNNIIISIFDNTYYLESVNRMHYYQIVHTYKYISMNNFN